jgi:hypothetical protein
MRSVRDNPEEYEEKGHDAFMDIPATAADMAREAAKYLPDNYPGVPAAREAYKKSQEKSDE